MDYFEIRKKLINDAQILLPAHLKRLTWQAKDLAFFQLQRLRKLLAIAKAETRWYQNKLKNIDPTTFELPHLSSLPTLDKNTVMQHWDDLITIKGLTKKIAENHLEQLRNNKITNPYLKDKYLFIATGGSSGVRGLFIWDEFFLRETACINYRFIINDQIKNNTLLPAIRMATIEAPTLLHGSQHLFTINVLPTMEVKALNVLQPLEQNIKILNDFKPHYLVGFASYVTLLAKENLKKNLHITPQWVSTNSEILDEGMRNTIRLAWQVEACNSWGSVEIGSVAMENNMYDGMIIAEDGVILELVDEHLQPVNHTRDARKILATSLFNYSMPLIRYVIDDIMDISSYAKDYPAYRVIRSVLGRSTDWFYYNNIKIPPDAFMDILTVVKEVNEYQIIQTKNGALLKLVCNNPPNINEIINNATAHLLEAGLPNPIIEIEIVTTLDKNLETGKVKRFIPLSAI